MLLNNNKISNIVNRYSTFKYVISSKSVLVLDYKLYIMDNNEHCSNNVPVLPIQHAVQHVKFARSMTLKNLYLYYAPCQYLLQYLA